MGQLQITDIKNDDGIDQSIELREDMAQIFIDMMELFSAKSKDYTNSNGAVFEDSGLMGQHLKLTDKVKKLRKTMWDAEILREAEGLMGGSYVVSEAREWLGLRFEDTEEILMDIVGHCALAISILRSRAEEKKVEDEKVRSKVESDILRGATASDLGPF